MDSGGNVVVLLPALHQNGRSDSYTAKYAAANGALLWEKRNGRDELGPLAFGYPTGLAVDAAGSVLVAGRHIGDSSLGSYTIKYSADGILLWEQHLAEGEIPDPFSPRIVAVDGGGNVVVVGRFYNGENCDFQTTKYAAADGAVLWTKRFNGSGNRSDWPTAVALDGSGNVVVTGIANVSEFSLPAVYMYTAKYAAADGALLWEKRYGPKDGSAQSVAVDASGNVTVTGTSDNAYYTAKYTATEGTLGWEQAHRGPANRNDQATGVAVDGGGNVIVTGVSENENGAYSYTAKYAATDGTLIWSQHYRGPGSDFSEAVALDKSGNVVMTGNAQGDVYTAKYAAADGALLWEQRYNQSGHGSEARAVAIDGSGNAVITGYITGSTFRADYYTVKYAAADGALLWEKHYNSPANGDDRPNALAVDSKGNVVVTGGSASSHNSGALYDSYTLKYAAADGALLWERRYNGPASLNGQASAVAVDGSGNVLVTGQSSTSGSAEDGFIYTAKYAAQDGLLVWEKRYQGLGNGNDGAAAIAVDSLGNVVAAGYSRGNFYTAKYAGSDGMLLWEKLGPVGDARAVRVTGSGDVVVAGNTYSSGGTGDYYTAKYASADGALLWEKLYNGPANSNDFVSGLAIGADGRVAVTGSSDGNFASWQGDNWVDYATVVYREKLSAFAVQPGLAGIRLSFTGTTGQAYSIQRATAVTGPWLTLITETASSSGLIEYMDDTRSSGAAFYRTVTP